MRKLVQLHEYMQSHKRTASGALFTVILYLIPVRALKRFNLYSDNLVTFSIGISSERKMKEVPMGLT